MCYNSNISNIVIVSYITYFNVGVIKDPSNLINKDYTDFWKKNDF